MNFLEQLKDGVTRGNYTIQYRYNKTLEVYERADVGYDNWTQFCIIDNIPTEEV